MKTMTAPDYTDHHRQEALEEEERRMAMERYSEQSSYHIFHYMYNTIIRKPSSYHEHNVHPSTLTPMYNGQCSPFYHHTLTLMYSIPPPTRSQPARAVSPSLVAAKNVNVNRDFLDEGERKVGMMMTDDDDDDAYQRSMVMEITLGGAVEA